MLERHLRKALRRNRSWVQFQEINREGWLRSARRSLIQRRILTTPPIRTEKKGETEVRILTWRRDWLNALWALKSFYHFAGVSFPLFIHDGGLTVRQRDYLSVHFPDATIISQSLGDSHVHGYFEAHQLQRCTDYRRKNIAAIKVFDFFVMSTAERILSIDSDILFFRRPAQLLTPTLANRYNKDCVYGYSMSLDDLERWFGIRPASFVNSGLSLVSRASINFRLIHDWLGCPEMFSDVWVTEQTLHALCSHFVGTELLPAEYCVSTRPGLTQAMVCKHYPGFFRYLLYHEGMQQLISRGFIEELKSRG